MKRTKASPTRNYTISCTSWLGRFITEFVPYAHVMLDADKAHYTINAAEYLAYAEAAYADLKLSYEA